VFVIVVVVLFYLERKLTQFDKTFKKHRVLPYLISCLIYYLILTWLQVFGKCLHFHVDN